MPDKYEIVMPWGKYKGKTIEEIPSGYLKWLEDSANCDDELKEAAQSELEFRTKLGTHFYE